MQNGQSSRERSRTVTWDDPMRGAEAGRGMSGLEFLQSLKQGELPPPPMMLLLGIEFVGVEPGVATFAAVPDEYHYNPIGSVHAGLAATLLDSAMGCAVHSVLAAGDWYTTLELKVNLVRALSRETGRVECEGRTIHVGSRTATAEARLMDSDGRLYAHATTTCMVFRRRANQGSSE